MPGNEIRTKTELAKRLAKAYDFANSPDSVETESELDKLLARAAFYLLNESSKADGRAKAHNLLKEAYPSHALIAGLTDADLSELHLLVVNAYHDAVRQIAA